MLRACVFIGVLSSALLWHVVDPGGVQARPPRGGFHPGFRPPFGPGFRGAFATRFTPRFGSAAGFGFRERPFVLPGPRLSPRFFGGMVTPGFSAGVVDRRFIPTFSGMMFDPRLHPGF